MYKLVRVADNEFVKPDWITDMRTFNYMPEPWVEITETEYWRLVHRWVVKFNEFRQVYMPEDGGIERRYHNVHITYSHDAAFAVMPPQRWHYEDGSLFVWDESARYFRIGCTHDYAEVGQPGSFLHTYKCRKCEHDYTVDSSG